MKRKKRFYLRFRFVSDNIVGAIDVIQWMLLLVSFPKNISFCTLFQILKRPLAFHFIFRSDFFLSFYFQIFHSYFCIVYIDTTQYIYAKCYTRNSIIIHIFDLSFKLLCSRDIRKLLFNKININEHVSSLVFYNVYAPCILTLTCSVS